MKNLLLISLIILTSGCSLLEPRVKPVEVITVQKPAPVFHPPLPLELQLLAIEWKVLTPTLMEEYLALLKDGSAPPQAYYALTTKYYENLSMNMADQKRYLKDIIAIIKYYREINKNEEEEEETEK